MLEERSKFAIHCILNNEKKNTDTGYVSKISRENVTGPDTRLHTGIHQLDTTTVTASTP